MGPFNRPSVVCIFGLSVFFDRLTDIFKGVTTLNNEWYDGKQVSLIISKGPGVGGLSLI